MSRQQGDTNERPVWRSVIHEVIAKEVRYFTDAAGIVDKVALRASVNDSLARLGGDVDRLFTADARLNAIREQINIHFSSPRAAYVGVDREARDVNRRAAYYRQVVQVPLPGNDFALKPRLICTLGDARLMADYFTKRQHKYGREARWWLAVIVRMEKQGCAEDAPITAVVRVDDAQAA